MKLTDTQRRQDKKFFLLALLACLPAKGSNHAQHGHAKTTVKLFTAKGWENVVNLKSLLASPAKSTAISNISSQS